MRLSKSINFLQSLLNNFSVHTTSVRYSSSRHLERSTKPKRHGGHWESVIGLEIHAQISSNSKLFSGSEAIFDAPPNTKVSFFDASFPGTLPVLNKRCVEAGILTALALGCTIHKESLFDRKHYFYADLPAGYQITQQRKPLASNGYLEFLVYNPAAQIGPYVCSANLHQLQLEQDSGKSLHFESERISLINLNRAGIGLMELVFDADLSTGEEAAALIKELQLIMLKIGTCSCRMEEGAFRVDANISVNRPGEPWGVRTEVKNINSMRFVAKAIEYEVERQIELLEKGGTVVNETRMFDSNLGKTVPMRDKEVVQDYRYMPEPNLPPLRLREDHDDVQDSLKLHMINIDHLRRQLPILPKQGRDTLVNKYHLSLEEVAIIVSREGMQEYYEKVMSKEGRDPKKVINIVRYNITSILNDKELTFVDCPLEPEFVGEVVEMLQGEQITPGIANRIIPMYFEGETRSPKEIVQLNNWFCIVDEAELEKICQTAVEHFPNIEVLYSTKTMTQSINVTGCMQISDAAATFAFEPLSELEVKSYRKGKSKALNKLMEEVAQTTQYRAHMRKAKEIMIRLISANDPK